jgi:hypothetical protein
MKIWFDPVILPPIDFDFHCKSSLEALPYLRTKKVLFISIGCNDIAQIPELLSLAIIIESLSAKGELPPIKWTIHTKPANSLAAVSEILKTADNHWHRLYSKNTGFAVTKSGRLIVYPDSNSKY